LVSNQAQRSYSPGEKIVIAIELRDASGVDEVTGLFSNRATNDVMRLRASGRGERRVTVRLEKEVTGGRCSRPMGLLVHRDSRRHR
jgi:hypothetical protein